VQELEDRTVLSPPGAGWQLVFDDEFNGTALDTTEWSAASPSWTMPNSLSTASAGQVSVGNGVLTLKATRTSSSGSTQFSSGSISSYNKFDFAGGYVEARIKLPSTPGSWPAFWGLYNGWPPEADIMEYPLMADGTSGLQNNQYNTNYHYTNSSGAHAAGAGVVTTSSDLRGTWHTFGLKWDPGTSVTFYLDGRQVQSYTGSSVAQMVRMYMILDYAVGGWPGTPSTTQWPVGFTDQTQVDYVRLWQQPVAAASFVNGGFEDTPLGTGWTLSGSAQVVGFNQLSGSDALRMNGGPGTATQVITGLSPNTRYVLSGSDRVSSSSGGTVARLGVKDYGGPEVWVDNSTTGYTYETVTFTTGPNSTQATVYASKPANGNAADFDDLSVYRAPTLTDIDIGSPGQPGFSAFSPANGT